ncbi:MAG: DUF3592 domain-containing protein [Fuerstiella sp.]|nr:DUF3592 domain-containing protein [Fuerstiella sp.]
MNRETVDDSESLAETLSELLNENITVNNVETQERDGVRLSVVEMSYLPTSDSSHGSTRVQQTGVMLEDDTLEVPQFALWPHFKRIVGKIVSAVGHMPDINFDDSPDFSKEYHLLGWNEEAVRTLFIPEVRDHLAQHPGWTVRGNRSQIAVFKKGKTCKPDDQPAFISESFEMLTLFRQGEQCLDEQPQIGRSTQVADAVATAQQMGGIAGSILRNALKRISLTNNEIDQFLAQPKPRMSIPTGLRRQYVGDARPLIALGIALLFVAIALPIVVALALSGNDRYFGIPVGAVFLLAGGLTLFFSIRSSRRKHRVVCEGELTFGQVTAVKRTSTEINGQRRYHLHLTYDVAGSEHKTRTNIYSGVEQAKDCMESGQTVRILVDPMDSNRVLCIDTLAIID